MTVLKIQSQGHLTFPTNYVISSSVSTVESLEFEECVHLKIRLIEDRWRSVKKITIRNAKYIELVIDLPSDSMLEEIEIENTEYMHIKEIRGDFPNLQQIMSTNCQFMKVSGPFEGDNRLQKLSFNNSPYLSLFRKHGSLTNLNQIEFNECARVSFDLSTIELPSLESISIRQCDYFIMKKSPIILPFLTQIVLDHSNYAQIPDLLCFPAIRSFSISGSVYVQMHHSVISASYLQMENSLIVDTANIGQKFQETQNESKEIESIDINTPILIEFKICPYCGEKLSIISPQCSNCHASFNE
jgi:hypothetical protein